MCGIIGMIGENAVARSFSCLKALEYRGYDSWGVAYPSAGTPPFYVEKHVGHIGSATLSATQAADAAFVDGLFRNTAGSSPRYSGSPTARIALGHTRWATHGNVSERNAHPHLSNDGKIVIVHNGIVENFAELKQALAARGFHFNSDTDSEVIANLIQLNLSSGKNTFEEAFRLSLLSLEGSYAVAALHSGEEKLVCARNGSPLVIGLGKGGKEFFAASDATAFIAETKNVIFLNDLDMAIASDSGTLKVLDTGTGKEKGFAITELKWSMEQAAKGSYPHFMLKEIFEQPSAILAAAEQPAGKISELAALIRGADRLFLAGCGSSYHACLLGTYFLAKIAGIQAIPVLASEYSQHRPFFGPKSLVIGISQSGETADLLECLKEAKARGAKIAGIVNVMDSSVMRLSDCAILMNAGPEICVLSTKSFISQLAILFLLAHALAGKEDEGKALLKKASGLAAKSLAELSPAMKTLAKNLSGHRDIFVIGRQEAYPAALESALKIKEVSYIHAEGFAGAELKHGTIALIEEGTPAIVLICPEARMQAISNAIEMKSRGAFIIGIDSKQNDAYDFYIPVPQLEDANPIGLIMPIQILSYYLAIEKNLDPDHPRNLAKSCTVK